MIFPVCLLIADHKTLYNLNIVLSFQPHVEPHHCPVYNYRKKENNERERKKEKSKFVSTGNEEVFNVCVHIYSLCRCRVCIKQLKARLLSLLS